MGWVGLGPQAAHNNAKLFFEDIWKLEDIWKFEDISKLEDISNAKELFSETCFWQFYVSNTASANFKVILCEMQHLVIDQI